ncbi:MAG: squalene/phytoene synthase family protein [Gemmatimonadales bacterium]|nr:squalene/phytoene synthase family protein [Gemmatimonadales bacterium]NIN11076.1 squalene/phytoene synthase family protein [Gemmatimonadales bacterium]NIN49673.1 squalene/phytoene synthase family protein [Gemmatimonadales bacterium]NIP07137.1 squalene/phytoene synthase family protein [Gemmatimonadales bacterium]NIQ99528.1 squalene/phytoene synthase family protein [Gemmatimonadales bacterium]
MTGTMVAPSSAADRALCVEMLPRVSRTFAICIRLLPAPLDYSVLVAYLLCRIADTIEDSIELAAGQKDHLLQHFSRCLDAGGPDAEPLQTAFAEPSSDHELLAREADTILREFRQLPAAQQDAVRPWVKEMSAGMAEFSRRRDDAGGKGLEALATIDELDRYCYYVAGTVGHLLTDLFHLHGRSGGARRYARLKSLATSFGRGLQLTNIIKDVADDRRRGWSFVPRQLCQVVGICPEDLQDERHREEGRRVMLALIDKTKTHLLDALDYSTTLSRTQYGIRRFCLASLYFAVRTLRLAERDKRLLDPHHKVKITRGDVYRTLAMTRFVAPSNTLVRTYFRRLAGDAWWRRRPPAPVATPS